ncbi:MAG: LemA family protein [Deltaproteobacteria bacterium]|nr:LemA family protein [Deltaproteobacteria bacterium]
MLVIIISVIFGILLIWMIAIYNNLIFLNNNLSKAFSNIDVMLKQQFDEIPKLIEVCKGFMQHEKELLTRLTELRTQFLNAQSLEEKVDTENQFVRALKSIFAVSENYPELRSSETFLQLQRRISDLQERIADRREYYNEAVALYNSRLQSFPDILIAKAFNFKSGVFLEIPQDQTQDVKISFT